jgi:hypothetical protein
MDQAQRVPSPIARGSHFVVLEPAFRGRRLGPGNSVDLHAVSAWDATICHSLTLNYLIHPRSLEIAPLPSCC